MSGTDDGRGLRERKRRATRDAIERNAIDLVIEHGYDAVTVDMICDAAMISQRTFFNYAGSKERAVLGIDPPLPSPELQEEYIAGLGGSPLRDILLAMSRAFVEAGPDQAGLVRKRREVLMANPELAIREFTRMEDAKQVIMELVRRRLQAEAAGSDTAAEAEMTFALAFGIMHHLAHTWMGGEIGADPEAVIDDAYRLARDIITA